MKKFLAILFATACATHTAPTPTPETVVVRVVDGDTVKTENETIRLIGQRLWQRKTTQEGGALADRTT